jgi:hypothetical protein
MQQGIGRLVTFGATVNGINFHERGMIRVKRAPVYASPAGNVADMVRFEQEVPARSFQGASEIGQRFTADQWSAGALVDDVVVTEG